MQGLNPKPNSYQLQPIDLCLLEDHVHNAGSPMGRTGLYLQRRTNCYKQTNVSELAMVCNTPRHTFKHTPMLTLF